MGAQELKRAGVRARVLARYRQKYAGDAAHAPFGPTLAAEHLRGRKTGW
jgi:hypothetical protein